MKRLPHVFIFLAIVLVSLDSCKEGCKDPNALNYVSDASTENGTCLYCKDTSYSETTVFTMQDDYNSGSIYFGQNIIKAIVYNSSKVTNGNGCKAIGKIPQNTSIINITLVNLTDKTIDIRFSSSHQDNTLQTDFLFSHFYFNGVTSYLTILPHDSVMTSPPINNSFKSLSFSTGLWQTTFSYFNYH